MWAASCLPRCRSWAADTLAGEGSSLTQWWVINTQTWSWVVMQVNVIKIHTLGPQGVTGD